MPTWAMDCLEDLLRLLIRLVCRLLGADKDAIDALLDLAEELG